MATKEYEPISDTCCYTHSQLGKRLGRSDRWAKEFIRANVTFADLGNGLFMVTGRHFLEAIERICATQAEQPRAGVR
tara:strand:- start:564 stop:794 length:231 start_codon:yes stop_codon:yes gene_type:complete